MKKIQKLLLALSLSVVALPAFAQFATPTNFIPTPMSEDEPLRFYVGADMSSVFKNSKFTGSNTKDFALMNTQLNLALIYNVGMGLDVGLGLHGGMFSPYGLGNSAPTGSTLKDLGAMFGADFMVRYMAMVSDMFYAGLQYQVGYGYTDQLPGATDAAYTALGAKSKGEWNSFIPMNIAIPLGVVFKDAAVVYVAPALELGQTSNLTNSTANAVSAADLDKGIWKSALGFNVAVGAAIDIGATKLVLQVKPRMANFKNSDSWGMDFGVGAYWNF
jgi:hypothetical protein